MATEAIIRKLNPYELHGVLYYQIALSDVSAPEQVYMARLSHDVVYDAPAEGDTVLVDKLLSMVTGIRKKDT